MLQFAFTEEKRIAIFIVRFNNFEFKLLLFLLFGLCNHSRSRDLLCIILM